MFINKHEINMRTRGICSYQTHGQTVAFFLKKNYSEEKLFTSLRENTFVPARTKQWKETKEVAENNDAISTYGWILVDTESLKENILIEIETKNWLETFK